MTAPLPDSARWLRIENHSDLARGFSVRRGYGSGVQRTLVLRNQTREQLHGCFTRLHACGPRQPIRHDLRLGLRGLRDHDLRVDGLADRLALQADFLEEL